LKGREFTPSGASWDQALAYWKSLPSDDDAVFDTVVTLNAAEIEPQVTWGTSPEQVTGITNIVPAPEDFDDEIKQQACANALDYMPHLMLQPYQIQHRHHSAGFSSKLTPDPS
jgi:3-isopropylmalate/(R)-2-methylmalate dehydratase large subunit